MRLHEQFEWHRRKSIDNLRKHHVSFEDAARALADPQGDIRHLEFPDLKEDYNEERWITLAPYPPDPQRLLYIVWTQRESRARLVTRIISARLATRNERRRYEQEQQAGRG